jgi:polyhydroxyalkanoate synthase
LNEGSWWEAMHAWLHERSGTQVAAPVIKPGGVLGDAPGEYVMVRYAD